MRNERKGGERVGAASFFRERTRVSPRYFLKCNHHHIAAAYATVYLASVARDAQSGFICEQRIASVASPLNALESRARLIARVSRPSARDRNLHSGTRTTHMLTHTSALPGASPSRFLHLSHSRAYVRSVVISTLMTQFTVRVLSDPPTRRSDRPLRRISARALIMRRAKNRVVVGQA